MKPFDYKSYLLACGVLTAWYLVIRYVFMLYRRVPRDAPEVSPGMNTKPIDASKLAGRLRDVRENYEGELHSHPRPPSFKHELLVKGRREEVARQEYFQHQQQVEDEEEKEEHGGWLPA